MFGKKYMKHKARTSYGLLELHGKQYKKLAIYTKCPAFGHQTARQWHFRPCNRRDQRKKALTQINQFSLRKMQL